MLWGLGVGYVISGMYFGWNLGLEKGGTFGLAIATFFIIIMYVCFTLSYAELACAIPRAGGAFDYADKASGRNLAFIAGAAQIIEFLFAPPAIALAIGAYFNLFFPQFPVLYVALFAYLIFTALNIYGVKAAANFELIITILAVAELLIFAGVTLPRFSWPEFSADPLPNGYAGAFAAIPFAIWFFLAIEGIANVAEEAVDPQKTIQKGFGWAIVTLVILCLLTFFGAAGVAGWKAIVFAADGSRSDSPLPLALAKVAGDSTWLYHLLISIGLLGLVASFHGIILAAGRCSFEFGRVGLAPAFVGRVHPRFRTPANALAVNMIIGVIAIFSGKTSELITISVFGALLLYIISMISFFMLRIRQPGMPRPFKVPAYPLFPLLALIIALVSMGAMIIYNIGLFVVFAVIIVLSFALYKTYQRYSLIKENPQT
jgi:ethanolamine permease